MKRIAVLLLALLAFNAVAQQAHDALRGPVPFTESTKPPPLVNAENNDRKRTRSYAMQHLVATAPNQVWTWDISKLATHMHGVFLNLYLVLDMFSRFPIAWMVAEHENSALAKQLFA